MKKIFLNFLAVILVFSLFSCNNVLTGDTNMSDTEKSVSSNESNTKEYMHPVAYLYEYKYVTVDEYHALLNRSTLPDDFLRYEDISYLGEFDSLTIFSELVPNKDTSTVTFEEFRICIYLYSLNNDEFYIGVYRGDMYPFKNSDFGILGTRSNDKIIGDSDNYTQCDINYEAWGGIIRGEFSNGYIAYYHYNVNNGYLTNIFFPIVPNNRLCQTSVFIAFDDYYYNPDDLLNHDLKTERTVERYDFSNEELNKFLYKDSSYEAFNRFYEKIGYT